MSLKFAAVGSLMALSALEARAETNDQVQNRDPVESYDPLLAMIGRGRSAAERELTETKQRTAHRAQ
jgi:hypothetical protein